MVNNSMFQDTQKADPRRLLRAENKSRIKSELYEQSPRRDLTRPTQGQGK